jgi:hypothetical protein
MSDAIKVALESAIRIYESISPGVITVEHKQAIDALQALQSGEPVVFTCHGNNAPAYGCNKPGDMSGTYYKAPQPVVPEGYVLVSKTALDGALYLAGLAVAHTDFGSQHRADFKVCCDALPSAGAVVAPQSVVPDFVYDGWSVYQFLSDRAKTRTSTDNVSDVLDAIKALLKAVKGGANRE